MNATHHFYPILIPYTLYIHIIIILYIYIYKFIYIYIHKFVSALRVIYNSRFFFYVSFEPFFLSFVPKNLAPSLTVILDLPLQPKILNIRQCLKHI